MTLSEIIFSAIIGVASGFVATGLWWVWGHICRDMILPWYSQQKYQGVLIQGEWTGGYTNYNQPHSCSIRLEQVATRITGELIELEGPDKGKRYSLNGEIRDLILTLIYAESNFSRIDRGVIALTLRGNGSVLEGHTIYYSDSGNELISKPYKWMKSCSRTLS